MVSAFFTTLSYMLNIPSASQVDPWYNKFEVPPESRSHHQIGEAEHIHLQDYTGPGKCQWDVTEKSQSGDW
jgi:hypothetical protein